MFDRQSADIRFDRHFQPDHFGCAFVHEWARRYLKPVNDSILEYLDDEAPNTLHLDDIAMLVGRVQNDQARLETAIPAFDTAAGPVTGLPDPASPFDTQMSGWMDLAAVRDGPLPTRAADAILRIPLAIEANSAAEPEGGFCPRIAFVDENIPNHQMSSGRVDGLAALAFNDIAAVIAQSHKAGLAQSPNDVWDQHVIEETQPIIIDDDPFAIGQVPIQMFGACHPANTTHGDGTDTVLLLQLGDGFGTPIRFMDGDMVVRIWIKPSDLAKGKFDTIEMTCHYPVRTLPPHQPPINSRAPKADRARIWR